MLLCGAFRYWQNFNLKCTGTKSNKLTFKNIHRSCLTENVMFVPCFIIFNGALAPCLLGKNSIKFSIRPRVDVFCKTFIRGSETPTVTVRDRGQGHPRSPPLTPHSAEYFELIRDEKYNSICFGRK